MLQQHSEITICMGSSCFSRGNKAMLQLIRDFLKENGLEDQVVFKGTHCMGQCESGPVLKINDIVHTRVDLNAIPRILNACFSSIQQKQDHEDH